MLGSRSAVQSKKWPPGLLVKIRKPYLLTWGRLGSIWWPTLSSDGGALAVSIFLRYLTEHVERIGPEKGVIHIATGAVDNALWDMFARSRRKPLWKLVVDMTPASYSFKFFRGVDLAE